MSDEPRVLDGRYRLDELIGRGGMASVYRGYDVTLGREVAIKLLARELASDDGFRTRFRLEAQSASRMSHPTIVRVYDAGETTTTFPDGTVVPEPYIVMELVRGTLVKDLIGDEPLSVEDAVRITDGILEALQYSHRAGVIHRDIKPGNVMVTPTGQVKVMDFGIARAVSDGSSTVAETTQILGTASYFSPEQAKGETVDARADLYSAGVVLFELLTGHPPFRGDTPVAVAYQHVSEAPAAPSDERDDVPPIIDAVVSRALAKDPFDRFPDAAAFRGALASALRGVASDEPPAPTPTEVSDVLFAPSTREATATAQSLRRLSTTRATTRTSPAPTTLWIWIGTAIAAVVLIAVLAWVIAARAGAGAEAPPHTVPDVAQVAFTKASGTLSEAGFTVQQRAEASTTVASGNVIRTDPAAGTVSAQGATVVVYVSTGVPMVPVPTLQGLSQDAATSVLTNAGLALGAVTQQDDPTAKSGTVLSASSAAGTNVPAGTSIALVVATGKVALPDLTGFTVSAAESQLQKLGLTPAQTNDQTCTASKPPTVKVMSVAPGEVPIQSTVTLTVCVG
ncbi:MAG: serine/threonine-protein kinase [Microbacterium sp.]|uniref:non-specific serine/threonine protein kinase n=1 Tax=Microbacterium ginsengisoli TaxID=400772 RepID=A0A0F0LTB5_9MICO|nr:Stk1 family PASTA domain-containing Ser/Thr kinase [Microbacterium ginsengisoli]KJL35964.1 Serine/threonine-protein kinase PknB [Microbacterium ginsengisoli]MAL06280.1 serine/threonine-protein kinase [Microbacterium sp.]HAN24191.1 Stk1 family PASTA domain-containing Ser/Thr kinase [Microbacterium ginsengisoli]